MKTIVDLIRIRPYVPGADADVVARRFGLERVVKLASNEYPLPPVSGVREAAEAVIGRLNRYPDAGAAALREALARHYAQPVSNVAVGNGSLELILLAGEALLAPGVEAVFAAGTFSLYRRMCELHGATPVEVPLRDLVTDLDSMAAAVTEATSLVIVCNPNNPTGTYLPAGSVVSFLERLPRDVLLVVDEAYVEFCTDDDRDALGGLVADHPNLMITRTFSKIYGLGGLRIGYALACEEVVNVLDTLRQPFNTNVVAQAAATEALLHQGEVAARRAANAELRRHLAGGLTVLGLASLPSQANFVFADVSALGGSSTEVCERLQARGAVVRDGAAFGLPGFARISVGTREEIEFLLEKIAELGAQPAQPEAAREVHLSMMIVMHEGATEEEVAHVIERLHEVGAEAHVSEGERVTVIGAIGDREEMTALPLEAMAGVDRVVAILKPYKLVSREFQSRDTVIDVRGRKVGGGTFAIIAGPCSIETEDQVMASARTVKEAGGTMLRGGAFKPRTSPYAFQGLGEDGLKLMAQARDATGLPIVTEVMDPRDLEVVCAYADVVQVGARNMQNFLLLAEVGKAGKPVLLKRGMSATVEEWLMSAEYILKEGNRDVMLCERGIRTFETATRNTLDISAVPVVKLLCHLPVIVDPSHATGRPELVLPLSLASVAVGADGLIVETHPNPEHALCDGPQSLDPVAFAEFAARVRDLAAYTGRTLA